MRKPWSISTTVRNPERLRDFLRVLKTLDGQPFNSDNQLKYQILLIQHKLYKPTQLTREQEEYYKDIEREMPYAVAEEIFNTQRYRDPAMRGRNSVAPMNKMGLCVAKNSANGVRITPLGEYFLSDGYDLGKIFFIHFLKWQLPNPASEGFSERDGFGIKPFIGTLHLIKEVNKKWKALGNDPVGITKEEFALFAPTLIHYRNIVAQAEKLVEYRTQLRAQTSEANKRTFKKRFQRRFAQEFLQTRATDEVNSLLNNLWDYGDNAIRYFRLTRYIYIRGGGFNIDLEPRRMIEIESILSSDNAAPATFATSDDYINYLADLNQPVLPWETDIELKNIIRVLTDDINHFVEDLRSKLIIVPVFEFKNSSSLDRDGLKLYAEDIRTYRRKLQELEAFFESQNVEKIREYIEALRNIHQSVNKKSIELERLTTLAINALNDAIEIKPNYPVGDDNEPTFTAPAGKPDIECFYEAFNSVCEVTMLTDRSQWYNEGQPVMRHVRDFEESYPDKGVYCVFVAPRLHQDTIETFWVAIKHGYRGILQKIVPLSITQLIKLLEVLVSLKESGRRLNHAELSRLYEEIIALTINVSDSLEWIEQIPATIDSWGERILAR
jgi:hypothetical protein